MTAITLWMSPGACSLAPHILLHEIGATFDTVIASTSDGGTLTETFTSLNPKQRVPVLALGNEVITELPAIATAISDLAPERHLMGATPIDTVRVYEWMNWLSGTLHGQGFGGLWRPHRFADDPAVFDSIIAKARRTIAECYDMIETKLDGPYSTGGAFTAVDPFLIVFYRWGNRIGIDMGGRYPTYSAFARGLTQRPSVAAALDAEQIAVGD
jgi:glutathione S-transferase